MLRDGFPIFEYKGPSALSSLSQDAEMIRCARCGEEFVVRSTAWRGKEHTSTTVETRPCPYCWKASGLPKEEG